MNNDLQPTFFARLARRPLPIFLGLAVGFLGCCIAGRVAARQQPFKNFVRFHPGLAPDSHYYPTFSHTLNLARQKAQPGKTLVIVGGNSVMHGVGQRYKYVWSGELQKLLGDDFVVLNLAMRGQWPNEFGGLIAERLATEDIPVVYITIGTPSIGWGCDWDGGTYPYFFWDGWGKGLIPSDLRRDQWLEKDFFNKYAKSELKLEQRRHGRVDAVVYADDLWNSVANRYRTTVWTPLMYPRFWRPHREQIDSDPGATFPFELVNNENTVSVELAFFRGVMQQPCSQAILKGEQYDALAKQFGEFVPDILRTRTLYVIRMEGMYYRSRLTPEEQKTYIEFHNRCGDAVRQGGLNAIVVGEKYEEKDFFDRSHFSERGGRKLAAEVAPAVRAVAAGKPVEQGSADVGEEP